MSAVSVFGEQNLAYNLLPVPEFSKSFSCRHLSEIGASFKSGHITLNVLGFDMIFKMTSISILKIRWFPFGNFVVLVVIINILIRRSYVLVHNVVMFLRFFALG